MRKLKCILLVDDDAFLQLMQDVCKHSPIAEIIHCFNSPTEFLNQLPALDFDLCLLDIYLPEMEGLVVAKKLGDKPIIFLTGNDNKLKDALDLSPIDILTKPIKKARLNKALQKTYDLTYDNREYILFNIAENKGKIKLRLRDILFVQVDKSDPRNKKVTMADGSVHILTNCTFDYLLKLCPHIEQVSKSELVSIESIPSLEHDIVMIKTYFNNKTKRFTLGSAYKKKFMERIGMK
jgi:DNA-binding LytR/AlgR family response regulator